VIRYKVSSWAAVDTNLLDRSMLIYSRNNLVIIINRNNLYEKLKIFVDEEQSNNN